MGCLGDDDRTRGLERRLTATRALGERQAADPKAMARIAFDEHRDGTLTLVVVNEVKRAQDTYRQLVRLAKGSDQPEVALVHSRFRPADRQEILDRFIVAPTSTTGPGRIIVATQVVEAGVDISAATLLTDAAPWSSIVQRAGRCNRAGERTDARLLWVRPAKATPYDEADLAASVTQLRALEGEAVTSTRLRELGQFVAESEAIVPVLRKRDLVDLFDTSPDLVGNDIDISRFIRSDGDTDVQVAWRIAASDDAEQVPFEGGPIRPVELCRVPIGQARSWLKRRSIAWGPDHLAPKRRWRRIDERDVRAGMLLVVDASAGGYDPITGWDGATRQAVPVVLLPTETDLEMAPVDEGSVDDPATFIGTWVTLDDHLGDTAAAARSLVDEARMSGLVASQLEAVVRAAALHDLGKAHDVFQDTLVRSAGPEGKAPAKALAPLAKSGGGRGARHTRPHFRHELVSALMLLEHGEQLLSGHDVDADLVRYLVAAHHGRVRLSIRSIPGETPPPGRGEARVALGVVDGDIVPALQTGGVQIEPTVLRLDVAGLGAEGSWTAMALALRDHEDFGLFRLAALEALTRLADWRASAAPSRVHSLDLVTAAQ